MGIAQQLFLLRWCCGLAHFLLGLWSHNSFFKNVLFNVFCSFCEFARQCLAVVKLWQTFTNVSVDLVSRRTGDKSLADVAPCGIDAAFIQLAGMRWHTLINICRRRRRTEEKGVSVRKANPLSRVRKKTSRVVGGCLQILLWTQSWSLCCWHLFRGTLKRDATGH